jgi:DnaJ-domain-containing protein 1
MDYFALLDQPRLPWLDPVALKSRFLALSAGAHPDRVHGASPADKDAANQRYAELNAAYNCLREPKDRLIHLVDVETGRRPEDLQENPASLVDLFFAIAPIFQGADKFLKEKARVTSPLAKVQLFQDSMNWSDQLMGLQSQISARREKLETELRALNDVWAAAKPLDQATALGRQFSFLKRWSDQIQERISRLATD